MIKVTMPERDTLAADENSKELEHLKSIGLVNVPILEIDRDITKDLP